MINEPPAWVTDRESFARWLSQEMQGYNGRPVIPLVTAEGIRPYYTCPACGASVADEVAHAIFHAELWFALKNLQDRS